MKNLKNFTLELSPKPFFDTEKETAGKVIENMFFQWDYMCRKAESISVLLFLADGSEILEFSGDLNQTFEWAYWLGVANNMPQPPNATEREKRNTHFYPKKYREDVSPRPYSWIKTLVDTIKRIGREKYDKDINVGYLYDNGPEFAISDFKFKRHREIARGNTMYPNSFVVCTAKLNEDKRKYAGFPEGIPQDTTIGTFLGRQFRKLAEAVGLDYLWLSNGMGFGTETWNICGALFDKKKFYPEKTEQAKKLMLDFWQDITKELKGIPIQTRGTNFSAGTEIATDAAPLSEIYENNWADAPVNSPWAALNYNVGLEISAWMSHIAKLPNDTLRYRFYINDPWFMNSPWLDRYEKQPWDIYLPMSVSRIDENGKTETANTINLLTADDSWGNMPEEISLDVTSHLRNAFTEAADDIGPLLWVYPFDEYSRIENPAEIFSEDMFIGEAIQSGLPLNTVINSLSFRKIIKDHPEKLMGSILFIPASFGEPETLKTYTANGGKVIIYGSPKEDMATLLGLEKAKPIHGT
ncbi:MAG: hypothetical protein KBT47_08035, partial [Armatimonadetes bacterium]|nr:hypothetical protein [Candidatus Hippobium faecium]